MRDFYLTLFSLIFMIAIYLPSVNQVSYQASHSCMSQLLSVVHEIQSSFDCKPPSDVKSIFLDISTAFDKAWHQGLLFKLQPYEVQSHFLRLLKST